ncbi:MAG TPA: energy transducer TonB [Gemmatimonadaceae bacterium]
MMRLWVQSYAKNPSVAPVGVMSAAAHAVLIAAWVYSTMPDANVPKDSLANRVFYIPPPDKVPGPRVVHEVVRYVDTNLEGPGAGEGGSARMMGDARPAPSDESIGKTPPQPDTTANQAQKETPPPGTEDSVFSVLDVDTAVVRSANSAAPAYPLKLLEAHVTGSVSAQYVVDTTGFADTASFRVLKSTHPEFIVAVREALPYMRFQPAKIGPLKVRQLVEQQFSFKINDTTTTRAPAKKP